MKFVSSMTQHSNLIQHHKNLQHQSSEKHASIIAIINLDANHRFLPENKCIHGKTHLASAAAYGYLLTGNSLVSQGIKTKMVVAVPV